MVPKKLVSRANSYWFAAAVALVSVSTWAAYNALTQSLQSSPPATSPIEPAPVRTVAALGRIEPDGSVIKLSVANANDSRVDQILVEEGDYVRAGQVIAILHGLDEQQATLVEAEQNVMVQQAKFLQTQTGDATSSDFTAQQAAIARLQAQLRTETAVKEAAIARSEAELRNAQDSYERAQFLYGSGAISASSRDDSRKNYEMAQAQVIEARAELANTQQTLLAELAEERAKLQSLGEVRPVDVRVSQAEMGYALSQLASAQAELEDYYVRVPVAGQILRINTHVGEQVNAEQGIVDLGQTNQMYVVAEVYETDVPKLRIGQRATVVSENGGFTREIQGSIDHIGLQIQKTDVLSTDPAADQNARVVEVKIRLDPEDSAAVAGLTYMQVRVKIQLD